MSCWCIMGEYPNSLPIIEMQQSSSAYYYRIRPNHVGLLWLIVAGTVGDETIVHYYCICPSLSLNVYYHSLTGRNKDVLRTLIIIVHYYCICPSLSLNVYYHSLTGRNKDVLRTLIIIIRWGRTDRHICLLGNHGKSIKGTT